MATDLLSTPATTAPCERCDELTFQSFTADEQRAVRLDAEPVAAGLFNLDDNGRAVRRHLRDFIAGTPGYQEHECAGRPKWFDM